MSTEKKPEMVYLAPVAGHVVSRYGTRTASSNNQPIGYTRNTETGAFELIDEAVVVPIPLAEFQRFAREYSYCIDVDKSLRRVEEKDYRAWQDKLAAKGKKLAEDAKAAAKTAGAAAP